MKLRLGRLITLGICILIAIVLLSSKPNNPIDSDNAIMESATSAKDCEIILHNDIRDRCILNIASNEKDSALCTKITDKRGQSACISIIATALADPLLCREIENDQFYKDVCNRDAGIAALDEDACENIFNVQDEEQCYQKIAVRTNRPELCIGLPKFGESYCVREIAQKTQNPELCSVVPNEVIRGTCYYYIARDIKDPSQCDKITVQDIRQTCEEKVK